MKNKAKYISASALIVLGVLLIVFGIIMSGGFGIGERESFDLDFSNEGEFNAIEMKLSIGDIKIIRGEKLLLSAKNVPVNSVKAEVNKGCLNISSDKKGWKPFVNFSSGSTKIVLTIPYDMNIDKLYLENGVGELYVSDFDLESFELDSGVGDGKFENITAKSVNIMSGVGDQTFTDCNFNNLDLESGVGEVALEGNITGRCNIEGGVGEIDIVIYGEPDDYAFKTDKGIGDININGGSYNRISNTSADNEIYISNGVGEITVKFK